MIHEIKDEMTHDEALSTYAVERYLLGELSGPDRDLFEEHLFECTLCAADLRAGTTFAAAAIPELAGKPSNLLPFAAPPRRAQSGWQLWGLAGALAACLALIVYQGAVVVPRLQTQLAEADSPAVLSPLVLANAGARGDSFLPTVMANQGRYLLAVDIPPSANAATFRCTLVSSTGAAIWHVDVPAALAHDAVTLQVPAHTTPFGTYELHIEAVPPAGNGDTLVLLATYRYQVGLAKIP